MESENAWLKTRLEHIEKAYQDTKLERNAYRDDLAIVRRNLMATQEQYIALQELHNTVICELKDLQRSIPPGKEGVALSSYTSIIDPNPPSTPTSPEIRREELENSQVQNVEVDDDIPFVPITLEEVCCLTFMDIIHIDTQEIAAICQHRS